MLWCNTLIVAKGLILRNGKSEVSLHVNMVRRSIDAPD